MMDTLKKAVSQKTTTKQRKALREAVEQGARNVDDIHDTSQSIGNLINQHENNCNKILSLGENFKCEIKENCDTVGQFIYLFIFS